MKREPKHSELAERISALKNGPWAARGAKAWKELAQHGIDPTIAKSDQVINLEHLFRKTDLPRQRRLQTLLRAHWEHWTSDAEDEIRSSFEQVLSQYELYELAIENNYIPLPAIRTEARLDLLRLLWSSAARRYLWIYNYVTIAFLARRLDLDIGFPCVIPNVQAGNETRFASFLSQHHIWYEDALLEGWLNFLADYETLNATKDDKEIFRDFLKSTNFRFHDENALWRLVAGAERFILILSDLKTILSDTERPYYGSFYAYSMAQFYGYRWSDKGFFTRDNNRLDWSKTLLHSNRLREYARRSLTIKPGIVRKRGSLTEESKYWKLFGERNSNCENLWKVTREFLNSHTIHRDR